MGEMTGERAFAMEMLLDIVLDAARDTISLVPFLLVTYLVLESLEHVAGDRVNGLVKKAGPAGPVVGALLGMVPQCGFSAMGATLYAGRVVTLGTLAAVFLSTSDEMLPMLVAEQVDPSVMGKILGVKVLVALLTGVLVDIAVRALRNNARVHEVLRRSVLGVRADADAQVADADVIDQMAEAGEGASLIHRLCEQDHCGCDEVHAHAGYGGACGHGHDLDGCHGHDHDGGRARDHARDGECGSGCHDVHDGAACHGVGNHAGDASSCACGHSHRHGGGALTSIVRSALSHTIQVSAFIFLVTLVLVSILETVGEPALTGFLAGNEGIALLGSALVGLIPNCSASVVITQLYLEGVLGFGPMISGLLVSAGVGYLVLFRTNRHPRENAVIVAGIFLVALFWGLMLGALGL